MSDNWIILIPDDPNCVPDGARQTETRKRFSEIAPDADEIEAKVSGRVKFFDCGANLERIVCPSCSAEISCDWWQDRLDDDFSNDGFKLAQYSSPCCQTAHTLHELIYEWPQGFGRFSIEAMNPNIGELDGQRKKELEDLLGMPLRVIYQHL